MRFGLGVPTGTEGMMYPVPYADPDAAVRLALSAEELGFDSVGQRPRKPSPFSQRSCAPGSFTPGTPSSSSAHRRARRTSGRRRSAWRAAEAAARAREAVAAVSLDVNYPSRLWSSAEARQALLPLSRLADIVFAPTTNCSRSPG